MKHVAMLLLIAVTFAACGGGDHNGTDGNPTDWERNDLRGEVRSLLKFEYTALPDQTGALVQGSAIGGVGLLFNRQGYTTERVGYNGAKQLISKTLYQINRQNRKVSALHYNHQGKREMGPTDYQWDDYGFLVAQVNSDTAGVVVNRIVHENNERGLPVQTYIYHNGTLASTRAATYDKQGRMVESVFEIPEYDERSTLRINYNAYSGHIDTLTLRHERPTQRVNTTAMSYRHDPQGNWVECTAHQIEQNKYTIITREIEYYHP